MPKDYQFKLFHTGQGSRDRRQYEEGWRCPKCQAIDMYKWTKFYRVCAICGFIESRRRKRRKQFNV